MMLDSARELYDRTLQAGVVPSSQALDAIEKAARQALGRFTKTVAVSGATMPGAIQADSRDLPPLTLSGSLADYLALHAPQDTAIDLVSLNPGRAGQLVADAIDDPGSLGGWRP